MSSPWHPYGHRDVRGDELVPPDQDSLERLGDWILRLRPAGGSQVEAALMRALSFHPDVIFLLSDGAIPERALELVRQTREEHTVIHTVGFLSVGGEYTLRHLAEATDGIYRHVAK